MELNEITCPHCVTKLKNGRICKDPNCKTKTYHIHCGAHRPHRGICNEIILLESYDFKKL